MKLLLLGPHPPDSPHVGGESMIVWSVGSTTVFNQFSISTKQTIIGKRTRYYWKNDNQQEQHDIVLHFVLRKLQFHIENEVLMKMSVGLFFSVYWISRHRSWILLMIPLLLTDWYLQSTHVIPSVLICHTFHTFHLSLNLKLHYLHFSFRNLNYK